MPTKNDREDFGKAIKIEKQDQIRAFLQRDDAKELLLMKDEYGYLPIHDACSFGLSYVELILNAGVQHGFAKQMVEGKSNFGTTCLHSACHNKLSADSLRLLLEYFSKHADIKKMLEEKTNLGSTCLHYACGNKMSPNSFRFLLEYLPKHADIKKMLQERNDDGWTCLHYACWTDLPTDSLRLLLEYFSKYADIKKMLEEKTDDGRTCLHLACDKNLHIDFLQLLISFFPSNESFQLVLGFKDTESKAPLDLAKTEEHKQLLQDPNCWQKCRYWLFSNYQETFLNSLYPNSPEKTLEALKELKRNYADDGSLKKAIAAIEAKKSQANQNVALIDIERAERIFKGVQAVSSAEYYTWRAKEALSGNEETIANAAVKLLDKADFEKDWQNAKVGIFISALLTGAAESVPAPFKGVVTAISGIVRAVVAISANKYMAKQLADRLVSLHPAIFIMIKNKYPDSENLCKRLLNVIGECQELLDAFSDLGEGAGFIDKLKQKWGQFSKSAEDFNECHNKIDQILRDITFSTVQQELVGARQRPSRENLEESFRKETAEIISSITNHMDVKLDAKDSLDEQRSQNVLANISDLTRRVNILLERAGEKDVDALGALTSSYQLQDGELPGSVVTRVPGKAALGSGARATVYEGVFKKEIPVAMKEYRGTPTLVAALARAEFDLLRKLQSVNDVIRVYGIRSGSNELVMEKLDYSLEDFLVGGRCYQNGQRLNMEQKLSITMCLIRALRSLHAMSPKVIAGDIKPSNLLLTDSHYAVKMIDFGSAATRMTTMISAKGITDEAEEYSIPFAAPELLSRGTRAEATDIYAFAVTLLELWSEDHAYKNESDVGRRVVEQGLRPSFSSAPSASCPEVIHRVIEWSWAADSNLRPDAFKLNELRKLWAVECHASASQFLTLRQNQWPQWMQKEAPSSASADKSCLQS